MHIFVVSMAPFPFSVESVALWSPDTSIFSFYVPAMPTTETWGVTDDISSNLFLIPGSPDWNGRKTTLVQPRYYLFHSVWKVSSHPSFCIYFTNGAVVPKR